MANWIPKLDSNNFRWWGAPKAVPTFNQNPYMGLCPQRKNTWLGNQGVTSLTTAFSKPHREFVLPVLTTLGSSTPGSQRENISSRRHSKNPFKFKLWLPPVYLSNLSQRTTREEGETPVWQGYYVFRYNWHITLYSFQVYNIMIL